MFGRVYCGKIFNGGVLNLSDVKMRLKDVAMTTEVRWAGVRVWEFTSMWPKKSIRTLIGL